MDSFENRVNKAFGSLGTSSSWRLSDEQPQVKVWRRQEEEEEEEEEEEGRGRRCDGMDFEGDVEEEGRQMRGMVGLDATLDFEEEEDEFDKAAFGIEGNQERLYMMGIKEVDKKLIVSPSLPLSLYDLKKVRRDPRANHSAARARLEEDARGATAANPSRNSEIVAAHVDEVMESSSEPRTDDQFSPSEHLSKSFSEKAKPLKRVRFALDLEAGAHQETNTQRVFVRPKGNSDHTSKVPDHVRNPSKYTHYTLDWVVEDSNMSNVEAFKACNENMSNILKEECNSGLQEMPQKIQYINRHGRATGSAQKSDMEETNRSVMPLKRTMCIEHCDTETENVSTSSDDSTMDCKMQESVHLIAESKLGKPAKNYRVKREAPDNKEI